MTGNTDKLRIYTKMGWLPIIVWDFDENLPTGGRFCSPVSKYKDNLGVLVFKKNKDDVILYHIKFIYSHQEKGLVLGLTLPSPYWFAFSILNKNEIMMPAKLVNSADLFEELSYVGED